MTTTTNITVFGVKEALKELRNIDPDLRKQINVKAKDIAKPATDAIKAQYPAKLLSGMSSKWNSRGRQLFPYDQTAARKGVVVTVDTGRKSRSVIRIDQKNPAAAIIDMAGKQGGKNPQGAAFIGNLTALFGQPSRVMWPTYDRQAAQVNQKMFDVVKDLMVTLNRNLVM
jgi:hypothetical protein